MKPGAISWPRIFAEGTAIVVSILLAFLIDAAWDARLDREEEREVLLGLRTEFEQRSARLRDLADWNRRQGDRTDRALRGDISDRAADSLLSSIWAVNVIDRGGGPLDALLMSGRLELLRDHDLRAMLARWPDRMEDMHTNDLTFRDIAFMNAMPLAAGYGVPDGACTPVSFYCMMDGAVPPGYRRLLADEEFRSWLVTKRLFHALSADDQEAAHESAEDIIARIDSILGG